jgi:hypothetical protein
LRLIAFEIVIYILELKAINVFFFFCFKYPFFFVSHTHTQFQTSNTGFDLEKSAKALRKKEKANGIKPRVFRKLNYSTAAIPKKRLRIMFRVLIRIIYTRKKKLWFILLFEPDHILRRIIYAHFAPVIIYT